MYGGYPNINLLMFYLYDAKSHWKPWWPKIWNRPNIWRLTNNSIQTNFISSKINIFLTSFSQIIVEFFLQGQESYLEEFHKKMEVHGTVYPTGGKIQSVVPGYVHNHGILTGPELHRLLQQSKVWHLYSLCGFCIVLCGVNIDIRCGYLEDFGYSFITDLTIIMPNILMR